MEDETPNDGNMFILLVLLYGIRLALGETDCGETTIVALSTSDTGTIRSPNNPSSYGNLNHCVWKITGPDLYSINLLVPSFQGESSGCRDFLEVRDGSWSSHVLLKICTTQTTSVNVTSTNRYMWLEFTSNYAVTGAGFAAVWSLILTNRASPGAPQPSCRETEFRCANGQCTNFSDLCDNYADCGCNSKAAGCDEDPYYCDKTEPLTRELQMVIGLLLGVGVFLFIVLITRLSDNGCCARTGERIQASCTCRKCCGDPEPSEDLPTEDLDLLDACSRVGDDTGKRVTIVVHPSLIDRRPRYSIFAFDDSVLASPRVSAYLSPSATSGNDVGVLRDPGELLNAESGETPAYGIYGTVPRLQSGIGQRRKRTVTERPRRVEKNEKKSTPVTSPRSQERPKRRSDGTYETPAPIFKQIKSPSFPSAKYF